MGSNARAHRAEERLRALVRGETIKASIPVLLVIGFGVAAVARRPEFFWQDDFQMQYLPASKEIAEALYAGEWPLLSKYCWYGAGLAGEYQHGTFSLVSLMANWLLWQFDLSLPHRAAVLSLFLLAILAAGAFRLARTRALGVPEATLVALIAALNGWLINWGKNWYPSVASFAWLPWAWWALERALETRRAGASLLAGLFIYLMLAAGWPIGVLMIAVLTVCLVVRAAVVHRTPLASWPAFAAWLAALGWAAPALLMLVEYGQIGNRVAQNFAFDRQWMVPPSALLGMILPALATWWHGYSATWHPKASLELAGGTVPLLAVIYALLLRGAQALHRSRFDLGIAALALAFAMLPCARPFQSSFRWLPLAHLALALGGTVCLRNLREEAAAPGASPWAARARWALPVLIAASVAATALLAAGEDIHDTDTARAMAALFVVLALAWAAVERWLPDRLGSWPAVAFCVTTLFATYQLVPPSPDAPRWVMGEDIRRPEPYDRRMRYLAMFDDNELFYWTHDAAGKRLWVGDLTELRPGYTAIYAGLDFINGFSPLLPFGPSGIFKFLIHSDMPDPADAVRIARAEGGEGGLLDLMGVDGVVLSRLMRPARIPLKELDWHRIGQVKNGIIMQRLRRPSARVRSLEAAETVVEKATVLERMRAHEAGPAPIVLMGSRPKHETFAMAALTNLRDERLRSTVQVSVPAGELPALVLFARPWLPGWQASLHGQALPVEQVDALMPAVRVPAGARGELELVYRPRSLARGLWIALATTLAAAVWQWIGRRRTPPTTGPHVTSRRSHSTS